jgi:hypothetical protein
MEEQSDFFSPKHKRLLSIATWAKYLAWMVLIFGILGVGIDVIRYLVGIQQMTAGIPQSVNGFWSAIKDAPIYVGDIISNAINDLLRVMIYYLVLKSISLGLNMVVETDINYREEKRTEGNDGQ